MSNRNRWTIDATDNFGALSHAWNGLNQVFGSSPVLEARFVAALLNHFSVGNEMVAMYGPEARPEAAAIITPSRFGAWETFQPSQAPLGLWVHRGNAAPVDLMAELLRSLRGYPLLLSVLRQDPRMAGRVTDTESLKSLDYIETASVTINGTFDEYWAARGKNLRHNLKRQRNLLEREAVSVRFNVLTEASSMREAVVAYGELESRGWKGASDSAVHIDNPQGAFYTDLLTEYATTGNALVFQLYYDDRLVAVDLCIEGGNQLVMLKTAYDSEQKGTSPAMLLHQEEFMYLFNSQKHQRLEFFGRVMDWHTKWTDEIRALYHVNVYRNRILPLLHRAGSVPTST